MNIFSSTTFTWWQLGLVKWAVLFIGIAIGAYWADVFVPYVIHLMVVGLAISAYIFIVWLQKK
ncbi:hypothetical protein KKH15_00545 [Patescibacteria group bacterium]|nr:hypothetical protein [Patescibacteria group bacterium]MBU1755150.1 hypothetical protein [Patescibacteria group bacterium]